MPDISGIRSRLVPATDIPTPPAGKLHLFFDIADNLPKLKNSSGAIIDLVGAVTSFNSRTGNIIPQQADYDSFFLTPSEGDLAYKQLTANEVIVKKNPGTGEFSSVRTAVASITDASVSNPYIVNVGPGVYTENTITMQPYVYVVGSGQEVTVIESASASQNVFEHADHSYIGKLKIDGATGTGFAAIHYASSTSTATTSTLVEDVYFGANNILINHVAQGVPSVILCNNIRFGGANYFNQGFIATNNGSGIAIILMKNSNSSGGISGTFAQLGLIDGLNCRIAVNGCSFRTAGGGGTGNGFVCQNGGILSLSSVILNEFQKAIYLPNVGAPTALEIDALNFFQNVIDVEIDHAGATGYIAGIPDYQKTIINHANSVFIVGKDQNIITVAKKGGDFTSVASACASILDSGPTNPYLVSVNPGTYTEPLITIPEYVTITGGISASDNLAVIQPDANNHHVMVTGGTGCQLSYMTIQNAGSGFAAVSALNSVDFAMDQMAIKNCDIGLLHSATSANSIGKISHTDISGIYTHALQILSTGSFISQVRAHGFTTLCDVSNTGDDIVVNGTQAILQIEEANIVGSGSNIAIRVTNGGSLTTKAFSLINYATGILADSTGSNPVVALGVAIFKNISGMYVSIQNSTASGFLNGAVLNSQIFINPASSWFVTGQDLQVVTVFKRGGDYTSIATAIASITDASSFKPYKVLVGPGIFIEPSIAMKSFITVEGAGQQATIIQASSTTQKTIVGADNSSITLLSVTGATGAGGTAIYFEGSGTNLPFYAHHMNIGANETQCQVFGNTASTLFILESVGMGTGNFTNGLKISSNAGKFTQCSLINIAIQDLMAPFPSGDLINIANPDSKLVILGLLANIGTITGNGLVISDGAQCRISGIVLQGFTKGIWVENIGSAPFIKTQATSLENNTIDLQVDHPSTTGAFFGSATGTKVINDADATLPLLFQDITNGSTVSSGTLKLRFPGDKEEDVSTLIIEASTMGNMETNLLSNGGGLTVNVADGFGYLEIEPEILRRFDWNNTSIVVPANTESYIYFDNTGTLVSNNTRPDSFYNILIGRVVTNASAIFIIDNTSVLAEHSSNRFDNLFRDAFGPVYASGSATSENVTPFHLNVSSGMYYVSMASFSPSGGTNITFLDYYRDGAGGWTIASTNIVENGFYDDGTGTPHAISAGFYAKHSLYVVGEGANEKYFLVRSQAQYATLLLAENATIPNPPSYFIEGVVLIAGIIVQQGASPISEIRDERPRIGFSPSGTSASSDHQALSNRGALAAHSQYLLKANPDMMGNDLDMGGFSVVDVNQVDGVIVHAHAGRHLPNGADAEATSAPITNLDANTANATGTANSFSRGDHCFSEDTEILSENGFIPYEYIKPGTSVATLNLDTGGIEYQEVGEVFTYSNFNELISLRSVRGEILVTEGHIIVDENPVEEAENYTGKTGPKYQKYRMYEAKNALTKAVIRIPTIPGRVDSGRDYEEQEDFFRLIGIIISEGHFCGQKTNTHEISIFQNEDQAYYIENILKNLSICYTKQRRTYKATEVNPSPKPLVVFYLPAKYVREKIYPYIRSKQISKKLLGLRGKKFLAFIEGLVFGDGSFSRTKHREANVLSKIEILEKYDILHEKDISVRYHTGDSLLKDQLTHLLFLNGISTKSYFRNVGLGKGCWTINFIKSKSNLYFCGNQNISRSSNVSKIPYTGNVWCVSVPNRTVVVRRNGLTFITGNSHALNTGNAVTQNADQSNNAGVSANLSRADHIHNIPTATPVTIGTANAQGSATTFAKSDHLHSHGNQTGPTQHAVATISANGFMSSTDKTKLDGISGTTVIKAGNIVGSSFAGNPKTFAVVFGTPFATTNYAIAISSDTNRTFTYSAKATTGFTISANANASFSSGEVSWTAISNGEATE